MVTSFNLQIREAQPTDAASLLSFIKQIASESDFLTFGEGEFTMTVEQEEKVLEASLCDTANLCIIAEINGQIVGNLSFISGHRPRTKHFGKFGISVLKAFWGQGIGNELLSYLISWARTNQITKKINLEVRADHKGAIHLYEKLGFVVEGKISRYFYYQQKFYDALIMGLEIN